MATRPLAFALLLLTACAHAPAPAPTPPVAERQGEELAARCAMDVRRLFQDELDRRPAAQPQDLYLLLRQALLGEQQVEPRLLLSELFARDEVPAEPIVEDLDEVQGTVRLNLRKWRFIRGDAAELQEVVEASAGFRGDFERFAACLQLAPAAWAAVGGDAGALSAYLEARREEGWPAVGHSEKYEKNYQPAYRVVLRRHLPPWVTAPPPTTG